MSSLKGEGQAGLSREELQTTIDNLPQICFTATAAGMVTMFNKRWYIFTGLSESESLDVSIWKVSFLFSLSVISLTVPDRRYGILPISNLPSLRG